jgi:chaperonin GroES
LRSWRTDSERLQATSIRSIKSLVPLLDRVLVQRIKAESKTASGIFLPESTVKDLNEAKVLAVGPGALDKEGKRVPMGVTKGDRVLIPQVWTDCEEVLVKGLVG